LSISGSYVYVFILRNIFLSIMRRALRRVRAISPVIAEIIIVAIAIAISIAVAGWLMGLWGGYARTEQLQIISAQSTVNPDGYISIVIKNTGDVNSKIVAIKIGGYNIQNITTNNSPQNAIVVASGIIIPAGQSTIITGTAYTNTIGTGNNLKLTAGQTVTIIIVTESGKQFNGAVTVGA